MVDLTKTIRIDPRRAASGGGRSAGDLDLTDLSSRSELRTEVLDWSVAKELHARLLEMCASGVEPPQATQREVAPDLGTTRVLSPPAEVTSNLGTTLVLDAPPAKLDATIYDGGALRDYALMLAKSSTIDAAPAPTSPRGADGKRLRASKARAAERLLALRQWWRATPASQQLVVGLLVFTVVLAAAGKLPLGPRHESSGVVAPTPASVHRQPAAVPVAVTSRLATTTKPLVVSAAPPVPSSLPAPPTSGSRDPVLERAALRAAFDGNRRDAIAAYERLAANPGGEPFKLAARLLREDHVRKP